MSGVRFPPGVLTMAYLSHFQKTLTIRFLGNLALFIGAITLILGVEPVIGEEVKFRSNQLLGVRYIVPKIVTSEQDGNTQSEKSSGFASIISGNPQTITPVSTDFGVVVEKINANAKVIADVDSTDQTSYTQALSLGVAHAKGTSFPGQIGNIYLFSHSTDAPWNIIRYNAIFYLLNKLESGDRVIMFYSGRRYDYIVFDKIITSASDVKYLTQSYDQSVLTLQTCDPPGTILNRLIIRAKLVGS